MIEISNCLKMIRAGVPVPDEYNYRLRGWRTKVYRAGQVLSWLIIITLLIYACT